ncbi:MAG: hypothetical protein LBH08_03335 [Puniceicoccales bacterium]|jgi:hypothetical protein|nr:hypothetical protein [Puniceicoccales bacterium]
MSSIGKASLGQNINAPNKPINDKPSSTDKPFQLNQAKNEGDNEGIKQDANQSSRVSQGHKLEGAQSGDVVDKICYGIEKTLESLGRILGSIFKGLGMLAGGILDGVFNLIKSLTEELKKIVDYVKNETLPVLKDTLHVAAEFYAAINGGGVLAIAAEVLGNLPIVGKLITDGDDKSSDKTDDLPLTGRGIEGNLA